jgi:signal transduction histidine kinase
VEATLTEAAELHDIGTSGVELAIHVPDRPLLARADPDALQVVLTNLIGNAVKFTPGEGRTIEGRAREDAGQILVEVEDPGIGMDPNEVSSLFEAFRQASSGLDRTHEGPGLGLTVTKRLLDLLGGTIEVETERGEGTCVTVRLPAASGDAT